VAQAKRGVKKPVKKVAKKRRTVKELPTKLDFWAIACKEIYETCRRNGMDEGTALAFAMDRSSWPDWVIDPSDPIKKIGWEDGEEDV
jgi:hypothetical protein